jgi:hypothetical protein
MKFPPQLSSLKRQRSPRSAFFPRSILLLQTLFGKRVQENKAIMDAENRIEKRKTAGFFPQSP